MFVNRQWIPEECLERFLPVDPPLSNLLAENGISFGGISHLSDKAYIERANGAPYHVMLYSLGGTGSIEFGGTRLAVGKGDLAVIPASKSEHRHRALGPYWDIAWIRLDHSPRWRIVDSMNLCVVRSRYAPRIERCMEEVMAESSASDKECLRAVELNAELLSLYLRRELEASHDQGRDQTAWKLDRLWNAVDERLNQAWSVEKLAKEAAISRTHLFRVCESLYGVSPLKKVTILRMQRAKALLRNTDMDLSGIAEYIGYANPFAFSATFKRIVGESPRSYRKKQSDS